MASYGIDRIQKLLPHRYPFLLIDRVLEASGDGTHIVAIKNATFNEPFFQGHFPGMPIMPGVLQIEAMAQATGLMCLDVLPPEETSVPGEGLDTILTTVENARFRKMIVPGDTLRIEVDLVSRNGRLRLGKAHGKITVDGKLASEATLSLMLVPRKKS